MRYRFDACGMCDADSCDCGCSACNGEHIPTCIRCGLPTMRIAGREEWRCRSGCTPEGSIRERPQLGVCAEDDCAREVAARSMVATATDVYCSVLCAGKAAIKAVPRTICPVCKDGPGVPRYDGACDDICQAHLAGSAQEVA